MIFIEPPQDFSPRFEVVGCFVEYAGKILLLKRQPHKSDGGKWGIPAGKVDSGETEERAMRRELFEETGLQSNEDLEFLAKTYVELSEYDIVWDMFRLRLDQEPRIRLNPAEHQASLWLAPKEVYNIEAMPDLDTSIKMIYHV